MSVVRAKFKVTQVVTKQYTKEYAETTVVLEPQYDQRVAEDVSFSKATPTGRLEMRVDNPVALAQLTPGTLFYVDFTPIE